MAHEVRRGEIVIEIDQEKTETKTFVKPDPFDPMNAAKFEKEERKILSGNGGVLFFPEERILRSRLDLARFGPQRKYPLDSATDDLPVLPGERIHIDMNSRVGRITDGLGAPENADIYRKAISCAKSMEELPFVLILGEEKEINLRDDFAYYTWLFWMRRIVDNGCSTTGNRWCRPVQDVDLLPSLADIVKSNRVRVHYNEEDTRVRESLEIRREKYEPGYKENPQPGVMSPALMGM